MFARDIERMILKENGDVWSLCEKINNILEFESFTFVMVHIKVLVLDRHINTWTILDHERNSSVSYIWDSNFYYINAIQIMVLSK